MVRTPLTEAEWERGLALGRALQRARGTRSAAEVAQLAGISLDTLRKGRCRGCSRPRTRRPRR